MPQSRREPTNTFVQGYLDKYKVDNFADLERVTGISREKWRVWASVKNTHKIYTPLFNDARDLGFDSVDDFLASLLDIKTSA